MMNYKLIVNTVRWYTSVPVHNIHCQARRLYDKNFPDTITNKIKFVTMVH
jgi:hypothetical protein